jgi:Tfp pilus assembly protein PilZ
MRNVQVVFPSGRELLSSYWGFLQAGGLIIREPRELKEGETLVLEVKIRSLKQTYKFGMHVVRRTPDEDGEKIFVAFDDNQDQEVMLNAAWADTHEVPQRKHRRYPVTNHVTYFGVEPPSPPLEGKMLNLSRGGCRVKGAAPLSVGTRVTVEAGGYKLSGKIRWTTPAGEMGIEFLTPADDALLRKTA